MNEYEVSCTRCGNIVATVSSELENWAGGAIQAVMPAVADVDCGVCGAALKNDLTGRLGYIREEHLQPDERPFLALAATQGDVHLLLLRLTRERQQAQLTDEALVKHTQRWKAERALAEVVCSQLDHAIGLVRKHHNYVEFEPMEKALTAYNRALK